MDLAPHAMVGERYELLEKLGEGGFGEVWRARALLLNRRRGEMHGPLDDGTVALKVATRPGAERHLRREGAIERRLQHPGIVRVLDEDLEHDPPYVVLEYMPGGSLRERLRRAGDAGAHWLDPALAQRWLWRIASAVGHAHALGIIHGDLKPENILFDKDGEPCVSDFGLGTVATGGAAAVSRSLATREGPALAGTLGYIAPELFAGEKPDPRADVYALGVIAFEMLTGRLPQGNDYPNVGPAWNGVFGRCYIRKDLRFKDANELAAAVRPVEPSGPGRPGLVFPEVDLVVAPPPLPPSPPPPPPAAPHIVSPPRAPSRAAASFAGYGPPDGGPGGWSEEVEREARRRVRRKLAKLAAAVIGVMVLGFFIGRPAGRVRASRPPKEARPAAAAVELERPLPTEIERDMREVVRWLAEFEKAGDLAGQLRVSARIGEVKAKGETKRYRYLPSRDGKGGLGVVAEPRVEGWATFVIGPDGVFAESRATR